MTYKYPIDPEEPLDSELETLVKVLNKAGFNTFSSCFGHGEFHPFIEWYSWDTFAAERLAKLLQSYPGFNITVSKILGHENFEGDRFQLRLVGATTKEECNNIAGYIENNANDL